MGRHPSGVFMSGSNLSRGHRLANPRDPAVKLALKRDCPDCKQPAGEWCIGIAENSRTKGRRLRRLHFARCLFTAGDGDTVKAGAR